MRVWRDPGHPGMIEVYDDQDRLAARGHEEVLSVPEVGSRVRAVPILFVADWTREDSHPTDRPPLSEGDEDDDVQGWMRARLA
jgi:hypothetical protein